MKKILYALTVLLVILGLLMVTGVWTSVMSQLQGVIGSVELPL